MRYAGTRRAPPSSHLLPICYLPVTVVIVFLVFFRFVRLLAGLLHRELQKTTLARLRATPPLHSFRSSFSLQHLLSSSLIYIPSLFPS